MSGFFRRLACSAGPKHTLITHRRRFATTLPRFRTAKAGGGWGGGPRQESATGKQQGAQRSMSESSWASGIFQGATTAAANAVLRTLLSNGECNGKDTIFVLERGVSPRIQLSVHHKLDKRPNDNILIDPAHYPRIPRAMVHLLSTPKTRPNCQAQDSTRILTGCESPAWGTARWRSSSRSPIGS